MKNIEKKIKQAVSNSMPDVLHSVLSDCREKKGNIIMITEQKKSNMWIKWVAAAAAALIVAVGAFAGLLIYRTNYAVASTVSLDVNPSIEIQVNEKEKVLAVYALNNDAETVIGNMDFKGSSLEVTVNALIGAMLKNGYLSELSNSILISVEHGDQAKSVALKEKLTQEVNSLLQTDTFSGAVLSQTVSEDSRLQELAQTYGITMGKAQLIQQITDLEPMYNFSSLVPLSINELNLLLSSKQTLPENIDSVGTASTEKYIGAQKAQEIALTHANVQTDAAQLLEVKLDCDDGVMIYEVEFISAGFEYEYEIEAQTGDIIEHKTERQDDAVSVPVATPSVPQPTPQPDTSGTDLIGVDKAREIVFAHAGIQASDARKLDIETDYEDGLLIYEIEFEAGNLEYEYELNARTGEIIKNKKDFND